MNILPLHEETNQKSKHPNALPGRWHMMAYERNERPKYLRNTGNSPMSTTTGLFSYLICTCGDYGVSGDIMQTDRRHNARQATDLMGLMSSMWDGKFACLGVVEDVSARGIRISQVPSHFDVHAHQCVSIVHGPCHDLHITLRPCWRSETKKAMYQLIGFRIVTPTVHWAKFIAETFVSQAQKRPQGRGE